MLTQVRDWLFHLLIHPMWKWIIHRLTGECELLRIQYNESQPDQRTLKTEKSLQDSKFPECQAVLHPSGQSKPDIIDGIIRVKGIVTDKHPIFLSRFSDCYDRIESFRKLAALLEERRLIKYDETKHKDNLLKLWGLLKPDEPLENRFTRQWGDIGFQGTDPATDFRGMGILSLENLLYFAEVHTSTARQTLVNSNHPKYGYSFAIVGINLTDLCLRLYKSNQLKSHFYSLSSPTFSITDFHRFYCYVFINFNKLWMKEKPNIMQFNEMRDKYRLQLLSELADLSPDLNLPQESSEVQATNIP